MVPSGGIPHAGRRAHRNPNPSVKAPWGSRSSTCNSELLPKAKLRRLIRRSGQTTATVWVGKSGLTSELLKQIDWQLDSRELVKVKVHKSGIGDSNIDAMASKAAADANATLVNVRGRTFSLVRRMRKKTEPKRK